jgi:hypothetical protein
MLPQLEKLGAIEIAWGSPGSKHPNRYRLPAAFLELHFGKTDTSVFKDRHIGMNHFLSTSKSAASPRVLYVDGGDVTEQKTASISKARTVTGALGDHITEIYNAMDDAYPSDFSDSTYASKKIIAELINEDADFDEILAAAKAYGDHLSQNGGDTLPMDQWLRQRLWEEGNSSCPTGSNIPGQAETAGKPSSRSSGSSSSMVSMKVPSSPVPQPTPARSSAPVRDRSPWPTGSVPEAGNSTGIDRLTVASS